MTRKSIFESMNVPCPPAANMHRRLVRHARSTIVLGEPSVDASKTPTRISFMRTGPDGKSNLAVGIVRFRAGLREIAMARKHVPVGGDQPSVSPTEFQSTKDADLVLLARSDGVPYTE